MDEVVIDTDISFEELKRRTDEAIRDFLKRLVEKVDQEIIRGDLLHG